MLAFVLYLRTAPSKVIKRSEILAVTVMPSPIQIRTIERLLQHRNVKGGVGPYTNNALFIGTQQTQPFGEITKTLAKRHSEFDFPYIRYGVVLF